MSPRKVQDNSPNVNNETFSPVCAVIPAKLFSFFKRRPIVYLLFTQHPYRERQLAEEQLLGTKVAIKVPLSKRS